MSANGNVSDTINQLNQARALCLADPNNLYPQIVPGLAPIIHADAQLELRRWGADFLSETFASPVLAAEQKQILSVKVLDGLKGYLEKPSEDAAVVKSVVQTAASIYPYVFRHIISNPTDKATWQKMSSIKSSILKRMDTAPAGVRICCIKFVQRVVQVQTSGLIADPRRPDQNETSLALVPRDHPIIPPSNLEAEASGLLDRLLGVLQDNSSDALIVTATLNSLSSLVRTRAYIASKIVSTVLNFNPLQLANNHMTPKDKVVVKSVARTTMSFLTNIMKKTPNHPQAGRMQGYVDRLRHSLVEVFDETSRKRAAPNEPTDGLSDAKRQRLGAEIPSSTATPAQAAFPPLPSGPISYAQLFTVTNDQGARSFDVKAIPLDLVIRLIPPLLSSIDRGRFDTALNAVRGRYLSLLSAQPSNASAAANAATGATTTLDDEDDDYEPDFPMENTEQVMNHLDQTAAGIEDATLEPPEVALGPFNLPPPPRLSEVDTIDYSKGAVRRVFGTLALLDQIPASKAPKQGFSRLAGSNHDRDACITILTRIATRTSPLATDEDVKQDGDKSRALSQTKFSASDTIRDALYLYVMDDFRRRIDAAISWLNEEWYNERVQRPSSSSPQDPEDASLANTTYTKWMHKVLDGFLPFLDAKDKLLIRFLSEIPSLDRDVVRKVTRLASDPERVPLAVAALHYLVLLRPPVRSMALDAVEDLWRNYDDARSSAAKILTKWRPAVLQEAQEQEKARAQANGDSNGDGDASARVAVKAEQG